MKKYIPWVCPEKPNWVFQIKSVYLFTVTSKFFPAEISGRNASIILVKETTTTKNNEIDYIFTWLKKEKNLTTKKCP